MESKEQLQQVISTMNNDHAWIWGDDHGSFKRQEILNCHAQLKREGDFSSIIILLEKICIAYDHYHKDEKIVKEIEATLDAIVEEDIKPHGTNKQEDVNKQALFTRLSDETRRTLDVRYGRSLHAAAIAIPATEKSSIKSRIKRILLILSFITALSKPIINIVQPYHIKAGPTQDAGCAEAGIHAESGNSKIRKQINANFFGISGNAWTMLKNMTDPFLGKTFGGKILYNEFEGIYAKDGPKLDALHKEMKTKFDAENSKLLARGQGKDDARKNAYKALQGEFGPRINAFYAQESTIDVKTLQPGDKCGMQYPNTQTSVEAFLNGRGTDKWRTFNTHVGWVVGNDKDGMPLIAHNIHGIYIERADSMLRTSENEWGCRIVWAARPNVGVKALRPKWVIDAKNTESQQQIAAR